MEYGGMSFPIKNEKLGIKNWLLLDPRRWVRRFEHGGRGGEHGERRG